MRSRFTLLALAFSACIIWADATAQDQAQLDEPASEEEPDTRGMGLDGIEKDLEYYNSRNKGYQSIVDDLKVEPPQRFGCSAISDDQPNRILQFRVKSLIGKGGHTVQILETRVRNYDKTGTLLNTTINREIVKRADQSHQDAALSFAENFERRLISACRGVNFEHGLFKEMVKQLNGRMQRCFNDTDCLKSSSMRLEIPKRLASAGVRG